MVDVTKETRIVASPTRMLLLGLGGILMAGLSFAVAWPLFPNVAQGSYQQFIGWVGVPFFLVVAIMILRRSFGERRPTLTLSPQGFHFNSSSANTIPWSAVENVGEWSYKGTRMIIAKVSEETWSTAGMTRTARWTRSANQSLGVDGVAIPSSGMPVSFDHLMQTFLAYARTYGGR